MTKNATVCDDDPMEQYAGIGTRVAPEHVSYERSPFVEWPTENVDPNCANDDEHLAPDPEEALTFLKALPREGPWVLTAIVPDGATTTRTFDAADEAGVHKFIESQNGRANVYYTGNLCGGPKKKPTKAEMTGAIMLHTDDDPREGETPEVAKARILTTYNAHDLPPSIIVDSGNGLQAIWLLEEDYPLLPDIADAVGEIELRNRALAQALGTAPGTHNIERLLRLPGTINRPNAVKRKKGRVDCMAGIVRTTDVRYPLALFSKFEAEADDAKAEEKTDDGGAAELPPSLRALLYVPDHGANNPAGGYETRSHLMFAFVAMALRAKIDRDAIVTACLDEARRGCAIHAHCTENGGVAYVNRQIERAREKLKENQNEFERDENNKIRVRSQHNVRVALKLLGVTLRYDEFSDRSLISGLDGFHVLDDAAIDRLWLAVDQRFKFLPANDFFSTVVKDFARANKFHPVRDYLNGLKWDGVERLDTWLIAYAGATDTKYTRAVGALVLIAAVRRVRKPGCKFDEMLVLEQPQQGTDKSSALAALAVNDDWFSDDLPLNVEGKRVIEMLRGRWIIEAAELSGMKKADVEHLKAMLSRRIDRARMAWGRLPIETPRQCVIIGTTNKSEYLRDTTGNRRFWPVLVKAFKIDELKRDRDQLWAEAAARETRGEQIRLARELWPAAAGEQQQRLAADPFVVVLDHYLGDKQGKICSVDVWTILDLRGAQLTQEVYQRAAEAMRQIGWKRPNKAGVAKINGKVVSAFVRGKAPHRLITVAREGTNISIGEEM